MAQNSYFIKPNGDVGEFAPEEAVNAAKMGLVPASEQQVKDFNLQREYGSQPGRAFLEAAGRSLTFGLSTIVQRAAGEPVEKISGLEKYNPIASTLGTGAGLAIPAIATAGASLLPEAGAAAVGTAARLTAPSLISAAGRAVMGEAVPSIVGRAAQLGLGLAVEGALYSGSQVVHEAALGDPHLTAQSALSQIGLGAVLGGGLGGVLGVAERGIPVVARAGADALGNLSNRARGAIEEYYPRALEMIGQDRAITEQILATRGTGQLGNKRFLEQQASKLSEGLQGVMDANREAFKAVKLLKGEALENLLADAPRPNIEAKTQELINELGATAQEFKGRPTLRSQAMADRFEQVRDELVDGLRGGKSSREMFEALDAHKNILQGMGKTAAKSADFVIKESGEEATRLGSMFRMALEDESTWGKAGAAQAKVNGALRDLRDVEKDFLPKISNKVTVRGTPTREISEEKVARLIGQLDSAKGITGADALDRWHQASVSVAEAVQDLADHAPSGKMYPKEIQSVLDKTGELLQETRQQQTVAGAMKRMKAPFEPLGTLGKAALISRIPVIGPPAATALGVWKGIQAITNPSRVAEVLGGLERLNQAFSQKVTQGANALFKAGTGFAEKRVGLTAAQLARLETLSNSPERVQDLLENQTAGIQPHAPETAKAMQVATSSILGLLISKMPHPTPAGPLDKPRPVSGSEQAQLDMYASTLHDPVGTILGAMKAGTLRPEQVEAVKTTSPAAYNYIVSQVLEKAAGQDIPYGMRRQMSILIGQDLDGSLRGLRSNQSIADIASSMAPPPPPGRVSGARGRGATAAKAGKLHGAARMMSPGIASLNRESLGSMK